MSQRTLLIASLFPLGLAIGSGCSVDEGNTGLRGQILETITHSPLAGVEVAVGDDAAGWVAVTTDSDGRFELTGLALDATRMRLDGRPASTATASYPVVVTQVHEAWLLRGAVTDLPAPKYLPRLDVDSQVELAGKLVASTDPAHPAAEGWQQLDPAGTEVLVESLNNAVPGAVDPAGNPLSATVVARIAAGTFIKFPEGAGTVLSVTQIPVDELPHTLPEYVRPNMMVTFQPGGTMIDPPAPLSFGDIRGYAENAPAMPFTVWSLSHSMALFLELGGAHIEGTGADAAVVTDDGVGLSELGWHGPACTTINLRAQLRIADDETFYSPADGSLRMTVNGGGGGAGAFTIMRANVGGMVETGNVTACGGYFKFEYTSPTGETAVQEVGGWRCARNGGLNDVGVITINLDQTTGAPSIDAGVTLSSC